MEARSFFSRKWSPVSQSKDCRGLQQAKMRIIVAEFENQQAGDDEKTVAVRRKRLGGLMPSEVQKSR